MTKFHKNLFFMFFIIVLSIIVLSPKNTFALADCYYSTSDASYGYQLHVKNDYSISRNLSYVNANHNVQSENNEASCNWENGKGNLCSFDTGSGIKDKMVSSYQSSGKLKDICPSNVVYFNVGDKALTKTSKIVKAIATLGISIIPDNASKPVGIQIYLFDNASSANKFVTAANESAEENGQKIKVARVLSLVRVADNKGKSEYKQSGTIEKVIDTKTDTNRCEDILGDPGTDGTVANFLQKIFNYIKILGPILVIILSSLDFTKVVLSGDEKAMKKAQTNLGIRLGCAVGLFVLPTIVTLLINLILGTSGTQLCGIK